MMAVSCEKIADTKLAILTCTSTVAAKKKFTFRSNETVTKRSVVVPFAYAYRSSTV